MPGCEANVTDPLTEYARGMERGAMISLAHLLELVEEHRRGVLEPSAEGPTWDALVQLLRDALSRVQEGGWRAD